MQLYAPSVVPIPTLFTSNTKDKHSHTEAKSSTTTPFTFFFFTRSRTVPELESLQERDADAEVVRSHKRRRCSAGSFKVSDPVVAAIMLTFPIIPVNSDPRAGVSFHRSDVLHGADPAGVSGVMHPLPDPECGRIGPVSGFSHFRVLCALHLVSWPFF